VPTKLPRPSRLASLPSLPSSQTLSTDKRDLSRPRLLQYRYPLGPASEPGGRVQSSRIYTAGFRDPETTHFACLLQRPTESPESGRRVYQETVIAGIIPGQCEVTLPIGIQCQLCLRALISPYFSVFQLDRSRSEFSAARNKAGPNLSQMPNPFYSGYLVTTFTCPPKLFVPAALNTRIRYRSHHSPVNSK